MSKWLMTVSLSRKTFRVLNHVRRKKVPWSASYTADGNIFSCILCNSDVITCSTAWFHLQTNCVYQLVLVLILKVVAHCGQKETKFAVSEPPYKVCYSFSSTSFLILLQECVFHKSQKGELLYWRWSSTQAWKTRSISVIDPYLFFSSAQCVSLHFSLEHGQNRYTFFAWYTSQVGTSSLYMYGRKINIVIHLKKVSLELQVA